MKPCVSMCSAPTDENALTGMSLIVATSDDAQKRRKLTTDSGYGGDELGERRDSFPTTEQSFTRTSSLDSISEDDARFTEDLAADDTTFRDMADRFQNMNPSPPNCITTAEENDIDTTTLETEVIATSKTKVKRRRMTPVPSNIQITKPSQASLSLSDNNASGRKILFVEEEDMDDIEKYMYEDDFICPGLQNTSSRLNNKRNSWHGITEGEKLAKNFHRSITLTKSKSLDRGTGYPRRRKRFANMSIPSISLEELSLDNKRPGLIKQRSLNEDISDEPNKCLFGNLNLKTKHTNSSTHNSNKQQRHNSNLPAWMQEAVDHEDMTSTESTCTYNEEDDEQSCHTVNNEELAAKLQIPQVNWEKLNAEKNKTNKLLSDQRKALNKEKNKAFSRRRRKLTPSESPSHASLEKLSALKSTADEWKVTEEEEEEDDGNL